MRRRLVSLARTILSLMVIAAMGSSYIVAHANELDQIGITEAESDEPVYELGEKRADARFFIRLDGTIPNEPEGHPSSEYSEAIEISEALNSTANIYDPDYTKSQDQFMEDGFTIKNDLEGSFYKVPSSDEIKGVVSSFDPKESYVVWYVIKTVNSNIHVDGVIRKRENSSEGTADPIEPEPLVPEPGEIVNPIDEVVVPEYSFIIYTTNFEPEFEYDGQEHLIGGFVIEVQDSRSGELLESFEYDAFGNRRGQRKGMLLNSYAEPEHKTDFYFNGLKYTVNVDGAYLQVIKPGQYDIPFRQGENIVSLENIVIYDESMQVISTDVISIGSKTGTGNSSNTPTEVKKRNITLTAGTTVQNDDGKTLTNSSVVVTSGSLVSGHSLKTTILGSQTGPGESVNEISDYDIVDVQGNSVKEFYNVKLEKGRLVVVAVPGKDTESTNSTGSATTKILVKNDDETEVSNLPLVLGASRDGDTEEADSGQVLRARRAETGDFSKGQGARLSLIVLCLMVLMIVNVKRNKTE